MTVFKSFFILILVSSITALGFFVVAVDGDGDNNASHTRDANGGDYLRRNNEPSTSRALTVRMEKDTGGGKGLVVELEPGTVVIDTSEEHERTLGSRKWMYAYLATEYASGGKAFESTIKVTSGGRYTADMNRTLIMLI